MKGGDHTLISASVLSLTKANVFTLVVRLTNIRKRIKMKKLSVFTILTLVVLMSLVACGPKKAERPIKVGIVDCYSGPPAAYGEDECRPGYAHE